MEIRHGSSMVLSNALEESITPYCLFDSDYHTTEEINERYRQAGEKGVQLHIWDRKEIENYALVPSAICRVIEQNTLFSPKGLVPEMIEEELLQIVATVKGSIVESIASEIQRFKPKYEIRRALKEARSRISNIQNPEGLLWRTSGKQVISRLSEWSQDEFGVSLSASKIAKAMTYDEIPKEVKCVITAILEERRFEETIELREASSGNEAVDVG